MFVSSSASAFLLDVSKVLASCQGLLVPLDGVPVPQLGRKELKSGVFAHCCSGIPAGCIICPPCLSFQHVPQYLFCGDI